MLKIEFKRAIFFKKNVQRCGKGLQMMTYSAGSSDSSGFWLLFSTPVKGISFYDVPIGYVKEELRFCCELEPFNARNANSIRLKCPSTSRGRLQLT